MTTLDNHLPCPSDSTPRTRSAPARYALAAAGVGSVGLAGVGVVVPGMPTTVFLIIAAWCFARSCPWLTDRLIRNRFFAPFVRYLEPGARMPRRAKIISICIMWTAIALSSALVIARGAPAFVPAIIAALGLAGTWCIARQGCRVRTTNKARARVVRHSPGRTVPTHGGQPNSGRFRAH